MTKNTSGHIISGRTVFSLFFINNYFGLSNKDKIAFEGSRMRTFFKNSCEINLTHSKIMRSGSCKINKTNTL